MAISVLQHAQNTTTFSSGTSGTAAATFGGNTTAGSCLVLVISGNSGSGISFGAPTSVTTNGAAENWALQVNDSGDDIFIYANPNTAGGQTVIDANVTWTGTATATVQIAYAVDIYEVAGVLTVNPVDVTQSDNNLGSQGTTWTSTATATTANPNEIFIGGAWLNQNSLGGTSYTVTGPSSPWVNATSQKMTIQYNGAGSGNSLAQYQIAGYDIVGSTGTGTYSGTVSVNCYFAAVIVSLKAPLAGPVINQWAHSYGQGTTLATITPVLQSCVVPLTNTYSVGGGSGTPTAGNWLFTIASWTQDPSIDEVHVGVGDDLHSWWRQYPASSISGNTRTSVSYTPNTARIAGNIYVAPDGEVAAINVLVVEVSGLGPWDTVVGPNTNYAAAATSLSLSLGAPGAASFFIAGVGGDTTAPTQTFSPAGYTTLHSLSQTNGSNHLADNVLTSAYIASSSGSQSISASTSGGSSDLSGFLIGVHTTGTSPIPASQNPNWPYMVFEAAFGSGFNTPDSERTWTDISTRLWSLEETTGIQFQLGQLQATHLDLTLDNNDNYLASLNSSSPYYPDVVAGTPVRLRAAMGTLGGITYNRWYVLQRNAQEWSEQIDPESFRRFSAPTGTDVWAILSAAGPTPYRGEVYEDAP